MHDPNSKSDKVGNNPENENDDDFAFDDFEFEEEWEDEEELTPLTSENLPENSSSTEQQSGSNNTQGTSVTEHASQDTPNFARRNNDKQRTSNETTPLASYLDNEESTTATLPEDHDEFNESFDNISDEEFDNDTDTDFDHDLADIDSNFDDNLGFASEEKNITKKKKIPLKYIAVVLAILAISLTAYNTLRQSMSPAILPIINLSSQQNTAPTDDNFIEEAQKRIDEIKKSKQAEKKDIEKEKQSAHGSLMLPLDDQAGQHPSENSNPFEESVLTPLPSDLDSQSSNLPSLEDALKEDLFDNVEAEEIDSKNEFIHEGEQNIENLENPFSSDSLLSDSAEQPPVAQDQSKEIDEQKAQAEAAAKAKADADAKKKEEAARLAAEAAQKKAAEQRAQAEAAAKAKVEAQNTQQPEKIAVWKIRAAQPERAVLYDETTGDIEAVEAGDKIRGLGTIKSVAQKNGRWIVIGTQGIVSQ